MRKDRHEKKKKSLGKKIAIGLGSFVGLLLIVGGIVFVIAYNDVANTMKNTHTAVERKDGLTNETKSAALINEGKPFTVLLLGIDATEANDLTGRSDTIILATINPQERTTTLVSIARDTYISGISTNKINAAYAFGGAAGAMDAVEQLLNVPVNQFITFNMEAVERMVDAVGGVSVDNAFAFDFQDDRVTKESFHFEQGEIHLTGKQALAFSRMRYDDPRGDYGRQERQRQVIEAVMRKVATVDGLTNYRDMLTVLGDNMKTSLTWDQMRGLITNYRSAADTIKQDNLQGVGDMVNGSSVQVVSSDEINRVHELIAGQLK
ncbi:MAG: LCP family protein [Streptococcaceae bacterium]|jgi:LCP family protein required for cell wall assembly|nr:LCP family protein [Streptococcaceae bacterium]